MAAGWASWHRRRACYNVRMSTGTDVAESSLIEAARRGDRAALSRLLESHQQRVFGFGVKMCGDVEDAKEIAQETLLTLVRNMRDFRGEASISTWLYTVARSFCIKRRRRTKGAPAHHETLDNAMLETTPDAAPAPTPEQMLLGREARETVAAALDKLDPDWREVIVLRDIEGLSANEVAEVTGVSVAAVKSRLHRARVALRENLVALVGEAPPAPAPEACPDVLTMLSRKLEDEISPDVCAQMEAHLDGCPHCKSLCNSLKKTLAVCSALPTPSVPTQVQESLRKAVAQAIDENQAR
jgi:RNA polymerase sigma-70 factor, ECF subfamily